MAKDRSMKAKSKIVRIENTIKQSNQRSIVRFHERVDKPRGQFFHTNWTGKGGSVSSSSYNA